MSLDLVAAEPIVLGSGELYLGTVANPETATESEIVAALVNIGAIEGGAEITYKPSVKEVKSANRGRLLSYVTDEEITFKTGIITWNLDNFAKIAPATVTTDGGTGTKTLKLKASADLPINYLRFIHTKKNSTGTITLNIYKTQATNGFKFEFDRDKPVSIDYEFSALADDNGNYLEIIETFTGSAAKTLTSISCIPSSMTLTAASSTKQINILGFYNNDFNDRVSNPTGTTFSSSSTSIVSVNSTGLASRVANGSATITASNGTLTDKVDVTCTA